MKRSTRAERKTSMRTVPTRKTPARARIGKLPVVILPMVEYERMAEDLEMLSSKALPRKIEKARQEAKKGQVMTLADVKRRLGLS